jgi:hypothetical protein
MNAKRRGRPPAGARTGERVKDYPQLSVRVPPLVLNRLNALSLVLHQPQWRIVSRALERLTHELTPDERELVDAVIERKRKQHRGKGRPTR